MKKFVRQKSNNQASNVELDFKASASKLARIYEPGDYELRINDARVIGRGGNILIALDLVETDSGGRVDNRPIWVDGPNADAGTMVAENQNLIAQLLTLAGLPTAGNVSALIPKLAGLEFGARLVLAVDNRSGRSFNALADVYTDQESAEAAS